MRQPTSVSVLHSGCVGCSRALERLDIRSRRRVHLTQSPCVSRAGTLPSRCVACASPHVAGLLLSLRRCYVGHVWAPSETLATTQNHSQSSFTYHNDAVSYPAVAGVCNGAEERAPHDEARSTTTCVPARTVQPATMRALDALPFCSAALPTCVRAAPRLCCSIPLCCCAPHGLTGVCRCRT